MEQAWSLWSPPPTRPTTLPVGTTRRLGAVLAGSVTGPHRARARAQIITPDAPSQIWLALAAVAGATPTVVAEQGPVTGDVPLTPIQRPNRRRFEEVVHRDHW